MALFNQYSAVLLLIITATAVFAAALILAPRRARFPIIVIGLGILTVFSFVWLQPQDRNHTSSAVDLPTLLASSNGRPVLVELYSDY